jgi:nitrous oxidase accessory protein NosD
MPDRHGPLRIEDFVAQTDGVSLDDLPASARSRLNAELADLTGGTDGPGGIDRRDTDGILVSEDLGGRTGFTSVTDALAGENRRNAGGEPASPPAADATVLVEPGTYDDGPVTVTTPGLTLLAREGPAETTLGSQVIVEADDATVAGFTVSPPDPGDAEGADEAVRVDGGVAGVTVVDNVVEGFARNAGTEFTGVDGINLFGGDGEDPVANATVRNNVVRRLQNTGADGTEFPGGAAGISVQGNVRNPTVADNTVEQIGQAVTNYGFGIVVRGTGNTDQTPTGVTIRNNTVDSVLSDPDSPTVGVGIGLEAGEAADVTFTGNSISNAEFPLEDKTATVDLDAFVDDNTLDRGALLEEGDFEGVPGDAPTRNVVSGSVQSALRFAPAGSTVTVLPGTYDDESTFGGRNGLRIGSQDAGTDPASAPLRNVTVVGRERPTIDGWVQILDPGVTFEGFELTGEVFGYGLAAFEPGVTVRDVTVSGATNGLFVRSARDVLVEDCTVENYSFYGALVSGRGGSGGTTPTIRDTTVDGTSGGGAVGIGIVGTDAELRDDEITGNEFEGENGAGIGVFGGASATVRENTVANNDDGIFVADARVGPVTVTSNDVVDNRVGVANESERPVDATGNWWGDDGGPPGTNAEPNEGPVDSDPWSTAAGPDWNAAGSDTGTGTGSGAGARTFGVASTEASARGASDWSGPTPPADPDRSD